MDCWAWHAISFGLLKSGNEKNMAVCTAWRGVVALVNIIIEELFKLRFLVPHLMKE
jgi:hypothetical protein